jgi:creatinine amidohydrolase
MDEKTQAKITSMRKNITEGGHADEVESSEMMAVRTDIVKPDRATNESGVDMNRLQLNNAYTGIWWYAKYPNHYAGEAKNANVALGEVVIEQQVKQLTEVIKAIKADQATLRLQNEFFKESSAPIETKVK